MPKQTMKFWTVALVAAVFFLGCSQQSSKPYDVNTITAPDYMLQGGKDHFAMRLAQIDAQPILNGGVLLAGDSITEGWLGSDIDLGVPISNHGIGWDTVTGLKARLPQMLRHMPDKVFILIGTNDIGYDRDPKLMAGELSGIIEAFQEARPETAIYVQSILPRESEFLAAVRHINIIFRAAAEHAGVTYIDLTPYFVAENGTLRSELTYDGLHLNQKGYEVWAETLKTYIQN